MISCAAIVNRRAGRLPIGPQLAKLPHSGVRVLYMLERAAGLSLTACVACLASLVAACPAQAQLKSGAPSTAVEDSLKAFLRGYLRTYASPMSDDKTARYSAAFVDLNGDGKQEVIVYVSGRDWCGTGGCTTFIFSPKGDTYRVVAEISVRHTPIRVLKSTSHGWHSISAFVRGETVIVGQSLVTEPNYEAELRFDGTTYDWVPSEALARPAIGKMTGEVVISESDEGTLLFP